MILPALETAARIAQGSLTASAAAEAALERIARHDGALNSFTAVTRERALAQADALDRARARGEPLPALAGVPFAVKNLFDVAGLATLAGAKIERERPAARADAVLVRRLIEAGAVLVGALNMDEYAYGFTTENTHYGATHNPHDLARSAGGSSGGSGAAVAAGLVPLALASDTNGSIRVPASLCGAFGLKPTYGRLSRTGSYPFAASLDHLGALARGAMDLAACYDALQGPDAADPACAQRAVEPTLPALKSGAGRISIAVAGGYFEENADDDARAAVEQAARALGCTRRIELCHAARARAAAFVITACEGANLHLADLKIRAHDFEPLSRDRFLAGALLPAAWYVQAQRFRRWFREQVLHLFADVDVILAPATPRTAPLLGEQEFVLNGVVQPVRPALGLLTQPISFIGLPVVAAPITRLGRLPIGVQIIAAPWREDYCLRVAAALEASGVAAAPVPARFAGESDA